MLPDVNWHNTRDTRVTGCERNGPSKNKQVNRRKASWIMADCRFRQLPKSTVLEQVNRKIGDGTRAQQSNHTFQTKHATCPQTCTMLERLYAKCIQHQSKVFKPVKYSQIEVHSVSDASWWSFVLT